MLLHSCFTVKIKLNEPTKTKQTKTNQKNQNRQEGGKLQNNTLMEVLGRRNKM